MLAEDASDSPVEVPVPPSIEARARTIFEAEGRGVYEWDAAPAYVRNMYRDAALVERARVTGEAR